MNGELCAWHYATGQPIHVKWIEGRFSSLAAAPAPPGAKLWVAPPLIDLQINGFAGVDFQQDTVSDRDLLHAATELRRAGCGRFLLTLVTDEWARVLARLAHLRRLRATSHVLRQAIGGWHLEGPFLSSAPGFCGAHNADAMRDPTPQDMQELRDAAGDDAVLVTLAPERKGAISAIRAAVSLGMKVSLGHTNASADQLRAAVAAGATGFTHLGNACPQQLDRHDNILWRVFDTPGLLVSLIPDEIHVSAPFFRLAHRVLGPGSIYYTSDAVAPAGAPPGRYSVGRLQVEVGPDQVVRQPGQTNYAGSALRPIDGVFRAARMTGRPWQEAWSCFSAQPARLMGWGEDMRVGGSADFCLLKVDEAAGTVEVETYLAGTC